MENTLSDLAGRSQAPALADDPRIQSWLTFQAEAHTAIVASQVTLARLRSIFETSGTYEDFVQQVCALDASHAAFGRAALVMMEIFETEGSA